jgi:RimJ/RimL family protein N-acetyltransferase
MGEVALRAVTEADFDGLFAMMRDPESVRMAAFTAEDPEDRAAFEARQRRIEAMPDAEQWAITLDGVLVGSIGRWVMEGDTEITYWVDRACWGQGIAEQAVRLMLARTTARPVFARAAADNIGSLRVLEKVGFVPVGTDHGYANGRRAEIEERVLRLE